MTEQLAIVGAGHAAGQLAASLVMAGYPGKIMLFGEEALPPYQRPPLSKKYLSGEMPLERLLLKPDDFYANNAIDLHLNSRVTRVSLEDQQLTLANGSQYPWDRLVFATGSRVRELDLAGEPAAGLHYLRSSADVDAIREQFVAGSKLMIIGGGYIGLEVAAVAIEHAMQVTLIEREPRLLSRVTSPQLSAFYHRVHSEAGVEILLGTAVTAIDSNDGHTVRLKDGSALAADLIIVGIGVEPNSEIAEQAGIVCDNGIVVDEFCKTSDARVLAIGDCTNHPNPILGQRLRLESVPNALAQARCAAATLTDTPKAYAEVPWFWSDQYDLKLQIVGLTEGYDEVVLRGDPAERQFSCFYLRHGRLIAVEAVNSPREFMLAKPAIAAGARIPASVLADPTQSLKDAERLWPAD